jgi:small-conductance mechanosensitive channel/CRP-like cAMP-binding protein
MAEPPPAPLNKELTEVVLGNLVAVAIGLGIAVALLALLAVAVPKVDRSRALRTPLLLLALYALAAIIRLPFDPATPHGRVMRLVAIFLFLLCTGRAAFVLVVDVLIGARLSRPLPRIIRDIIQGLVYFGALVIVLRGAGVEPGSLLTTSALLTAVIGLSLQETLGNLFAGLAIQAQRPFEVGDWIHVDAGGGMIGRVIEINWRATTVLTLSQIELIIPNATLAKTTIQNFTKPTKIARRTVEVIAPYDASPSSVEQALLSATYAVPGLLTSPPPNVIMQGFGDRGIVYLLNFWIDDFALRDRLESAVRQRIWHAFKRAELAIPYPQRVMYVHNISAKARAADAQAEVQRRLHALGNVDFLAALPAPALERLAALSRSRWFMAGEVILRQGDAGSTLYIVEKGEVSVLVGRAEASVMEVARLGPGKFFGEMSLMTGERRAATVQATLDCELVEVGKEAFHEILAADPRLVEQVSQVLTERQLALEENIHARTHRTRADAEAKSSALLEKIRQFFSL